MKYFLSLMAAVVALGGVAASSNEIEPGISLASLYNHGQAGSFREDRAEAERSLALVKEDEFASPETVAEIEKNREDRERTVVIDR